LVTDVEIVRLTEWVVWCKVGEQHFGIPRMRVEDDKGLCVVPRTTLRLPLWFARSVGLIQADDGKSARP
jgi:hypothetical protein